MFEEAGLRMMLTNLIIFVMVANVFTTAHTKIEIDSYRKGKQACKLA